MIKELKKLKSAPSSLNINYLLIPVSVFDITKEGARDFNKIYLWVKSKNLNKIVRTKSGAIKSGAKCRLPAWDVRTNRYCVEMTIIMEGRAWRIQFRTKPPEGMSGRKAFTEFKKLLLKDGIDLEDYAIDNGEEIKKEIEKPLIGAVRNWMYDVLYENVNHIDFHSSYPAGLANTHPEFRKTLEKIYLKRNEENMCKNILNFSIGFMQSVGGCSARWAHLSRDAIKDNNTRVKELAKRLDKSGRLVISFNTDGIWYRGPVYHGKGEGDNLGEWHNDRINCQYRMKSDGAYEFIENGIYYPVVRGIANDIKGNWEWGDIYTEKAKLQLFTFTEEEGISLNGEKVE